MNRSSRQTCNYWLFTSSYIPTLERKKQNWIWQLYLTSISDSYIWHPYLTFISDSYIWHLYLTFIFDVYIWHFYLTFISDISIWHLYLTFIFDVYIWHFYLTFMSGMWFHTFSTTVFKTVVKKVLNTYFTTVFKTAVKNALERQTLYFTVAFVFITKNNTLLQKTRTKLAASDPCWRLLTSPIVETNMCIFLM